ncbi:MAG: hypothetical protein Q7S75_03190 [bacterium]|nr:hypothetical protein [bacterium]
MFGKRTLSAIFFFAAYFAVVPQVAQAYIDPGTGSLVVQAVLAAIFGASFAVKSYWYKLKKFFGFRSPEELKDAEQKDDTAAD